MPELISRAWMVAALAIGIVAVYLMLLLWPAFSRAKDRLYLLGVSVYVAALYLSLYLNGAYWPWVSLHVRWPVAVALCVSLGVAALRFRKLPWLPQDRPWSWKRDAATLILLAVGFSGKLLVELVSFVSVREYEGDPIELHFPLSGVRAVVGNGGSAPMMNHHMAVRAQRYALDVGALDPVWARRAHGIYPERLAGYVIYGADVVAPCWGRVASVENDLPDQVPPATDTLNLAGNHIILHCKGRSVVLAHLRAGSVRVRVGEAVQGGQLVGSVGNSGNTSEPHLHIHAVDGEVGRVDDMTGYEPTPVPMLFHGKFLVGGDIIDARS